MNHAPSVACPVVRSRFHAVALALAWLAGVLTATGWWLLAPTNDFRPMLAASAVLVAGLTAAADWVKGERGSLRWSGSQWCWQADGDSSSKAPLLVGTLGAVFDLQCYLLVQFRAENDGVRKWLWCSQTNAPESWLAWRRAVFFRTTSHVPDAVCPPVASGITS